MEINNLNRVEGFKPPEEVAAAETDHQAVPPLSAPPPLKKPWWKWSFKLPRSRRGRLILGGCLIVAVVLSVGLVLVLQPKGKTEAAVKKPVVKAPVSTLVPSTLTGLPVQPAVNQRPVTAVMIENSLAARPQSGLGQAGVVFEAIAEGGVSRFLALYQDTAPTSIGPVRSARPYYVGWELGFDAAYAHVGGSSDALADIASWGVKNMDEFANGGSFQRVSSRAAPHNVYTSSSALNSLEAAKGYSTSHYQGFPRVKQTPAKTPSVVNISLGLSGPDYNPSYTYNPKTNSYDRSESGQPMIDAGNNQRVSPSVVIAIVVPLSQGALDSTGAYYSDYAYLGSGPAYIFQNGTLVTGQWSKPTNQSQISFNDVNGQPIELQPGQTWITAVGSAGDVQYSQ